MRRKQGGGRRCHNCRCAVALRSGAAPPRGAAWRCVALRGTAWRCAHVDTLERILAEEARDGRLHLWHARHAANQDDLVHLFGAHAGVAKARLARLESALDEAAGELLELGARELDVQVLRARRVRGDERQVDFDLRVEVRVLDSFFGGF